MEQENRVVVLIDMDCFYCQVEEKLDPELKGKPIAVVQYNPWKGGGIIAVNYVARARGVTRHMRGDEAREKCPEIQLPSVPCQRGKADISKYREAGKEVARVLQKFTTLLERASIDEAYLDITVPVQQRLKTLNINTVTSESMPNTYALGYESIEEFVSDVHSCGRDSIDFDYEHAKRLLVGAVIVSEIRAAVYEETGYRCSAGIAHNKILAKLVCGMNKPNKQTVLPKHSINILYETLSIKKVKHLGGKFGDTVCEILKINKMGELQTFSEKELQARFDEKNGSWLYNIARGIDLEPVQARFNPKSIGCCKQLRGKSALTDIDSLRRWLKDLGDEIEHRLEKDSLENNRTPRQMVVSFSTQGPEGRDASSSRSYNFTVDDEFCGDFFATKAFELVMESLEGHKPLGDEKNRKLRGPIKFLGISVGKFEDNTESKKVKKILDYFAAGVSNANKKDNAVGKESSNKNATESSNKNATESSNKNSTESSNKNVKRNDGKEYILQKFFKCSNESNVNKRKEGSKNETTGEKSETTAINAKPISNDPPVLESPLERQESFFARFLNKSVNKDVEDVTKSRAITPLCNVVNCGDDSNDSEYSGSTINMEINKSIALFEEDQQDVARVSGMRDLLNQSPVLKEDTSEEDKLQEVASHEDSRKELKSSNVKVETISPEKIQTFQCTECGKNLPFNMFDTHADYHFALALREEERRTARDERQKPKPNDNKNLNLKDGKKTKSTEEHNNITLGTITSFLMKIDNTLPAERCSECGKKVPVEKLSEHLDFHEAQKLNKELNKQAKKAIYPGSSLNSSSSLKRKRKSVSPIKKPKLSCTSRSIDSFFR